MLFQLVDLQRQQASKRTFKCSKIKDVSYYGYFMLKHGSEQVKVAGYNVRKLPKGQETDQIKTMHDLVNNIKT